MKIKFILPPLTESKSPFWRPIKYSLFPPLGLAYLAAYCAFEDEISIEDGHVEPINLSDKPDLVAIQVYITNAYKAYEIAETYRRRGVYVVLGGLHVTSLPKEAAQYGDTVILGLGECAFPAFLKDFKEGKAKKFYYEPGVDFKKVPYPRRDLFSREKYLVPNSMVFSRGCPNRCDFCYVSAFYKGKRSYYRYEADRIIEEIKGLKGKHLYFLDDNIFADPLLAREIFTRMKGMGKLFQGAVTVDGILESDLIEVARDAGFRSAFIGFESISEGALKSVGKRKGDTRRYKEAIARLDDLGIMINGSFIFGSDDDESDVFEKTVNWAVNEGITTATFHILTPYPGTSIYERMEKDGRITSRNWEEYDTRHLVFSHPNMSKTEMEKGYLFAYKSFYTWKNIFRAASHHKTLRMRVKHLIYSGAWKKLEWLWSIVIQNELLYMARRVLERTLK